EVRGLLAEISRARAQQGFSASATASFIFSLKKPLFTEIHAALKDQQGLVDALGLQTSDIFQKTREEVILRQQQDLLELSTPVVKLWDGILALPVIGTLDSARTQVVMESLLQRIV